MGPKSSNLTVKKILRIIAAKIVMIFDQHNGCRYRPYGLHANAHLREEDHSKEMKCCVAI
jgi:hypothetical protein